MVIPTLILVSQFELKIPCYPGNSGLDGNMTTISGLLFTMRSGITRSTTTITFKLFVWAQIQRMHTNTLVVSSM